MEIPMIDLSKLEGEERSQTMANLHHACEKGFFQLENHGVDKQLMEKVKELVNRHYEENMKNSFYNSEIVKSVEDKKNTPDIDWESSFLLMHRPNNKINEHTFLSEELRNTMDEYINQLIKVAERLSELMCENLGLEKDHIKLAFSGTKGPSVGTKVAKYPKCPHPELVRGLREHTDAGGIVILLQDDQVPGLEFLAEGKWVNIPPSKNNTLFVGTGDQIEVLSNGNYKSAVHRVIADKDGSRLSITTFYNPNGDSVISPAPKLLYPNRYTFQDYMKLYSSTKFEEKGKRFESMKKMVNGQ